MGTEGTPSVAKVSSPHRVAALRAITSHCLRLHPSRIFTRHLIAQPKVVRQVLQSPEETRRLMLWLAAAVEHGIAVWSENKPRVYARKLYSVLWALRAEVQAGEAEEGMPQSGGGVRQRGGGGKRGAAGASSSSAPAPVSSTTLFRRFEPWELAFAREESLVAAREDTMGGMGTGMSGSGDQGGSSLAALLAKLDALEVKLKEQITQPRRRCPRCGSVDMERIAVQTRSADEGMTMMLQCTACQQRIRI